MTRSTHNPLSSALERVRPLLESPRLSLFAALVAALLVSPSLFAGLATEDFAQRSFIVKGQMPLPSHVNLFGHDAAWTPADTLLRNADYRLRGWFPWVGDPRFDASFFRPLASLSHHLDYRAFPSHPVFMHAESILWYVATVVAVAALYRRLLEPRWAAGLASLLWAADDAHGQPVGWLINRNAVMATLFAVLSLISWDRFRRDGKRASAALTVLFLGLGLCSAEFALSIGGFFLAHALFVDEAPKTRRLLMASIWVATFGAWALVYETLGHSTHGSGLYLDPRSDPTGFAFELVERSEVLLMGQLGGPFSDVWVRASPHAQGLLVFFAVALVWLVAWTLWPLLREDRRARFWAAGLLLSLPPAAATFPEDRLLLIAGVGAFPLVVLLLRSVALGSPWLGERRRSATALAWAFVAVHALLGPLLLPYRTLKMHRYEQALRVAGDSAYAALTQLPGEALVFVNSEDFYFAGMTSAMRVARGEPALPRVITLAGTLDPVTIRRLSPSAIEVRPKDGFLSRPFNRIQRSPSLRFRRGEELDLRGVEVTVTEVNQWGEPLAAVFTFALPLDNERYRWVVLRSGRYEPFAVPPVGGTSVVGGA